MRIVASSGDDALARVYIAELEKGIHVEMVEAVQPPIPREKKWVLIISTLFGCPIRCPICDAGGLYKGKLSEQQIHDQLDFLIRSRFPNGKVPVEKLKVQFARMGEPALNQAVLSVLEELPRRYDVPGLMPCLSTVAPAGAGEFLVGLLEIKKRLYGNGKLQLQFSIHTTDLELRDKLIPVKKWGFAEIAEYGERFHEKGDRKITLNFALVRGAPIDPDVLLRYFAPEKYLIKITPVNPTYEATRNGLDSQVVDSGEEISRDAVWRLRSVGYEVIVSVGELEENLIGSNCGQYLRRHLEAEHPISGGYSYEIAGYGFSPTSGH